MKARAITLLFGALAACASADEMQDLGEATDALRTQAALDADLALHGAVLLNPRIAVATRGEAVLPEMLDVLLRGWGARPRPDCTAIEPGYDGDGDGVHSITRFRFDCRHFEQRNAVMVTLIGDVDLADENDRIAGDGWRLTFRGLKATRLVRPGGSSALSLDGEVLYQVVPLPSGQMVAEIHDTLEWHFFDEVDGSWIDTLYDSTSKSIYVPRPRWNDPYDGGQLRLDGVVHWQSGGAVWRADVHTEQPLLFDRSCKLNDPTRPGFREGIVAYHDAWSVHRIAFQACDQRQLR